jgi:hypothetical protein
VVNLEAEDHGELEKLCRQIKEEIPQILDIAHIYVNFEEEVEKMEAGNAPEPASVAWERLRGRGN